MTNLLMFLSLAFITTISNAASFKFVNKSNKTICFKATIDKNFYVDKEKGYENFGFGKDDEFVTVQLDPQSSQIIELNDYQDERIIKFGLLLKDPSVKNKKGGLFPSVVLFSTNKNKFETPRLLRGQEIKLTLSENEEHAKITESLNYVQNKLMGNYLDGASELTAAFAGHAKLHVHVE